MHARVINMLSLKKMLIALVLFILFLPPIALFIGYKIAPPVKQFQLQYREVLSEDEIKSNATQLKVNYCFEVPVTLELDNDLQDFMVAFSEDDLEHVFMSEVTDINTFEYEASEGCGEYAAILKSDEMVKAYEAYKKGEL